MRGKVNAYPGALVCAALADGRVVLDMPRKYDAIKQGDSPAWLHLKRLAAKKERAKAGRRETE